MKPNVQYFERNRGSWNWSVDFEISSYRDLWQTDLKLLTKFRISAFALTQKFLGPFRMWTHVDLKNEQTVNQQHMPRIKCHWQELSVIAKLILDNQKVIWRFSLRGSKVDLCWMKNKTTENISIRKIKLSI